MPTVDSATTRIRPATPSDAPRVRALLSAAELPLAGLPDDLGDFLVAERGDAVVAAIGLERYGRAALLRSAVVDPAHRGSGLGESLVQELIARATASGVEELVLLTTTAERWFPRFGFSVITRAEVPEALQASEELRGACPATAVVLRRRLGS